MTFDDYQAAAMRTAAPVGNAKLSMAIVALGVAGEAGEVADYVKKVVGHDHPLDKAKLSKELGDVLWYLAVLSDGLGLKLSEVAEGNIAKLRARYPEGFSSAKSMNREPEALECIDCGSPLLGEEKNEHGIRCYSCGDKFREGLRGEK